MARRAREGDIRCDGAGSACIMTATQVIVRADGPHPVCDAHTVGILARAHPLPADLSPALLQSWVQAEREEQRRLAKEIAAREGLLRQSQAREREAQARLAGQPALALEGD